MIELIYGDGVTCWLQDGSYLPTQQIYLMVDRTSRDSNSHCSRSMVSLGASYNRLLAISPAHSILSNSEVGMKAYSADLKEAEEMHRQPLWPMEIASGRRGRT
jgi:hypothetical protein